MKNASDVMTMEDQLTTKLATHSFSCRGTLPKEWVVNSTAYVCQPDGYINTKHPARSKPLTLVSHPLHFPPEASKSDNACTIQSHEAEQTRSDQSFTI